MMCDNKMRKECEKLYPFLKECVWWIVKAKEEITSYGLNIVVTVHVFGIKE